MKGNKIAYSDSKPKFLNIVQNTMWWMPKLQLINPFLICLNRSILFIVTVISHKRRMTNAQGCKGNLLLSQIQAKWLCPPPAIWWRLQIKLKYASCFLKTLCDPSLHFYQTLIILLDELSQVQVKVVLN